MKKNMRRKRLLAKLDLVLDVAEEKFKVERKSDRERRAWGRQIVNAVNAYGKQLDSVQLDDMMKEIDKIKAKIGWTEKNEHS